LDAVTNTNELRGREGELHVLGEALDGTVRGVGHIVLVEGEAGIGKTRLLDELDAKAASRGIQVRRGAAEELEGDRPFGALLEALGVPDTVPILGGRASSGAGDARFLAQDALVDHVEGLTATCPTLLAVDDLHWADRASLATLWALARRTADSGLLLVLAFRPVPQPQELARVIDGCDSLGAEHLNVGPIAEEALAELAADVVGARPGASLLEKLRGARGNPFVAIEVLRGLEREGELIDIDGAREVRSAGLPPRLRQSLLRRFTALGEEARTALSVAAVLGGSGRLDDLAALLGTSTADAGAAIAEATRAGLLEPAGDVLAFRHDLIREALYEDLPHAVCSGWHRDAARRLDGRAEPAVVARHLALGATRGDRDAVNGLVRSATELVAREPDAAADLLGRALELTPDDSARPEIGVARASALLRGGRAEDAMLQADAVLAAPGAPAAVVARAHVARANAAFHLGRADEAVDGFTAARLIGALDDAEAAHALAQEAANRMWKGELDVALEQAERSLAEGRRLGITAVQVDALGTCCAVHAFRAEPDAAIAQGRVAVELVGNDRAALRRTPHVYLGMALLAGDRLDEARDVAEEGRRLATDYGQVLVLRSYYLVLARISWFAGRWDDALAQADTSARTADDFGVRFGRVATEAIRGLVAFHRGEHSASRPTSEPGHAATRGGPEDASGSELFFLLQAERLEAAGDVAAAAATLLDQFEVEQRLGMTMARVWPGPTCVRLALAAGARDAATDVTADLEAIADRTDTASARAAALSARGLIEDDASRLGEAAAGFATAGRPFDQMSALEAAGAAHVTVGGRDEAIASLRAASGIADRLGAAHDGRRIWATLRELGVRSGARGKRDRAVHGWEALTEAEREVAQLVDDGLRNGQIAERLFVSRRTVESHVSRLYAKLGAENRVALSRIIREHSEPSAV
jgi:DNA-binding CsgD family transcriptional regulator